MNSMDDDQIRTLAEDIVRYCPSFTQLLLALYAKYPPIDSENPLPPGSPIPFSEQQQDKQDQN